VHWKRWDGELRDEWSRRWVLVRVMAEPTLDVNHSLYFAKRELPASTEPFREAVEMLGEGAQRLGHRRVFILVTADAAAHEQLQRNHASDRDRDNAYRDTERIRLPTGAQELARTEEVVQDC